MSFQDIFGQINKPDSIPYNGAEGITTYLTIIVQLIFVASGIILLFMILMGGFQWISSGGDKEAIGKARARITNAIIGMVIVALALFITGVLGKLLGFSAFI